MKKVTALFFIIVILLSFSGIVTAQQKAKTMIAQVKEKGSTIDFTLTSSRPFIFGNNRYILHIGSKEFFRNEQSAEDGKGTMTFFIPVDEFNTSQEGADIYLTYGKLPVSTRSPQELDKENFVPVWSLGKFSKSLLTK